MEVVPKSSICLKMQEVQTFIERETLKTLESVNVLLDLTKEQVRVLLEGHVERVRLISSNIPIPLAPRIGKDKEEEVIIIPSEEEEEDDENDSISSGSYSSSSSSSSPSSPPPLPTRSLRKRAKPSKFDPDDYEDKLSKHEVIVLDSSSLPSAVLPQSNSQLEYFQEFIQSYVQHEGIPTSNIWWERRFQDPLLTIMGTGQQNENFKRIIYTSSLLNADLTAPVPCVEDKATPGAGYKICYLCGHNKRCARTIWIPRRDGFLVPWPIGLACARLAQAVINFFTYIAEVARASTTGYEMAWPTTYEKMEQLFARILEANARK
jgi:hypothetical protein